MTGQLHGNRVPKEANKKGKRKKKTIIYNNLFKGQDDHINIVVYIEKLL